MKNEELFLDKVADFLLEANKHGYASSDNQERKEIDGSHSIEYTTGDWGYHDNYFGGEPYGGREVVFYKGRAVYLMVYYGSIKRNFGTSKVYSFLRKALLVRQKENPYRGPKLFEDEGMKYVNSWDGTMKIFLVRKISFVKKIVFIRQNIVEV